MSNNKEQQRKEGLTKLDEVELEYLRTFNVTELPFRIMMESREDYLNELRGALERGRPLEDEDRIDCDIIY